MLSHIGWHPEIEPVTVARREPEKSRRTRSRTTFAQEYLPNCVPGHSDAIRAFRSDRWTSRWTATTCARGTGPQVLLGGELDAGSHVPFSVQSAQECMVKEHEMAVVLLWTPYLMLLPTVYSHDVGRVIEIRDETVRFAVIVAEQ